MARIAGVNIPTGKRVPIALTYITGIGRATLKKYVLLLVLTRHEELMSFQMPKFYRYVKILMRTSVEGDLRREVQMNIKRMMDMDPIGGSAIVEIFQSVVKGLIQMQEREKAPQKLLLAKKIRIV